MQAILDEMKDEPTLAVQSNKGTDMRAAPFQQLPKSREIHFFAIEDGDIKYAMVERFQRTFKGMIHRHMTANWMHHLVDVLSALLHTDNSTHHSTIGMTPHVVNASGNACTCCRRGDVQGGVRPGLSAQDLQQRLQGPLV